MEIAALVSGGVDSSVVVYQLKEAGYDPTIFYIRIGMEDKDGYIDCPAEEDIEITSYIARKYGCRFEIVSLHDEYWDKVVSYTIDSVKRGLTPNPDMMCNKYIKFGCFEEKWGKDFDKIADTLEINIPEGKSALSKTELVVLDLLANYDWDRPIYFMQKGGDINIGIKDYMQYDGFVYKFVPIKSDTGHAMFSIAQVDEDALYDRIMNLYRWDNFKDTTLNMDYQHILTFNNLISPRDIMVTASRALYDRGKADKAKDVLDKMMETIPDKTLPLNTSYISGLNDKAVMDAIELYMKLGENEKADELAERFLQETMNSIRLFSKVHKNAYISYDDLYQSLTYLVALQDIFNRNGREEKAEEVGVILNDYIS